MKFRLGATGTIISFDKERAFRFYNELDGLENV